MFSTNQHLQRSRDEPKLFGLLPLPEFPLGSSFFSLLLSFQNRSIKTKIGLKILRLFLKDLLLFTVHLLAAKQIHDNTDTDFSFPLAISNTVIFSISTSNRREFLEYNDKIQTRESSICQRTSICWTEGEKFL